MSQFIAVGSSPKGRTNQTKTSRKAKKMAAHRKRHKKRSRAMTVAHPPVLVAGRHRRRRHHRVGASPFSSSKRSSSAGAAQEQKHAITAVGAAAAMGYLDATGNIPDSLNIAGIGKAGTLAVAAFFGAKMMKSKMLGHVATGLASAAAYNLAFDQGAAPGSPKRVLGMDDDGW